MGCQRRGENITGVRIHEKVQLSPGAALGWLESRKVAAMDTETRAVDDDVYGSWVRGQRYPNSEMLRTSRQGGVIRDAKA